MARKHYEWKFRDKILRLGERTLVMGILNVTPDSFSDGGKYADPDRAFARALELEEQGADIIDIGAESTRPGSTRVSEAEELRRLIPVLKRLQGRLAIPLSVDTYKSAVAAKALELGADIINDPTGLTFDADLARVVSHANAGLILNHMRGTPETWAKLPPLKDPISTIAQELDSAMHRAIRAGLERKRIAIDPGLGFGKRKEQNSEILARLDELQPLDLPLLVGASRKHFVAKPSQDETEFASAAAVTAAILYGAHVVRVHDVVSMKASIEVADEIARARAEREEAELAAKEALREQAKLERSSGPRRDASPYRQEPAASKKFSVPVVTGVVRPAAFSPLRPTLKSARPDPRPIADDVRKDDAQKLERAEPAQAPDDSLPSYRPSELKTTESELPGFDREDDLATPDDLSLDNGTPLKQTPPSPAERKPAAPVTERKTAKREWADRPPADRADKGKPRGFKPAARPPFKGPFDRRDDNDRREGNPRREGNDRREGSPRREGNEGRGPRPGGPREAPPARRGAYSRQDPSDTRRPFNRDAPRDSAARENTSERGRPPFRGKPSFGKTAFGKPPFGKKTFGKKPFGDKAASDERPSFGPKKTFGGKPSFGPKKSFGGKPSFGRKPFADKAASEDRPSFGPKKSFGGKPSFGRKPFADKAASDERPSFGPKKAFAGKPSFGPKKSFGGKPAFGRKPGGKFSGKSGGRPGGKPSGRRPPSRG